MNKRSADELCEQAVAKRVCDDEEALRPKYLAFEEKMRKFRAEEKLDGLVARTVKELTAVGGSGIKWFERRSLGCSPERALHFSFEEDQLELWMMSGTHGFRGVEYWHPVSVLKRATVPESDLESSVRMWILDSDCADHMDSVTQMY